jgi:hypothetical protein
VVPAGLSARDGVVVLDIGGANVNGSYRDVFAGPQYRYRAADISAGEGVDIVLDDPYRIPLPDASVDIVLSGQMLEHCEFFWLAFQEMVRLLKPDGFIFLIAPSAGPIHRYPVDCYRFYPDAYGALAKFSGCLLHDVWRDERGPWQDLVGVFRKSPLEISPGDAVAGSDAKVPPAPVVVDSRPEEEVVRGTVGYIEVLGEIHQAIEPQSYLEIGVRHGRSLALAGCPAVGVDPAPDITESLPATARVTRTTSDHFFDKLAGEVITSAPDLVFIDGMHLFEFALRDFMHVERLAAPATLVVIDDIFPNHAAQAARDRRTRVWTGDVWKLHRCLREVRPDLFLLPLDTRPTGLLLIAGLDPGNRVLWDRYNPVVKNFRDRDSEVPPDAVIAREGAVDPGSALVTMVLEKLRDLRARGPAPREVVDALRALSRGRDEPRPGPGDVGSRAQPPARSRSSTG